MHVKLPTPRHGWRAFAGEVGIIVVGVGIALLAEQAVEALHWRRVVADESRALDGEVRDMWDAMSARVAVQPCVDRRLADLKLVFAAHEAKRPAQLSGPIGRPRVNTAGNTALQIANGDGAISHMPLAQKQQYYAVYEGYDIYAPAVQEERTSWRTLQALNHTETLSPDDWRDLRKAYDDAVDSNTTLKLNLAMDDKGQWLFGFRSFPRWPVEGDSLNLPSVTDLCAARTLATGRS